MLTDIPTHVINGESGVYIGNLSKFEHCYQVHYSFSFLQLKIIASTEGRPPERIEDEDLGYATEGAIIIPDHSHLEQTRSSFVSLSSQAVFLV